MISWAEICTKCGGREHHNMIPNQLGLEIMALLRFLSTLRRAWRESTINRVRSTHPGALIPFERVYDAGDRNPHGPSSSSPSQEHIQSQADSNSVLSEHHGTSSRPPPEPLPASLELEDLSQQHEEDCSDPDTDHSSMPGSFLDQAEPDENDPDPTNVGRRGRFVILKPGSFPLEHIDVGYMITDKQFFNALIMLYRNRRSWFKRFLSIYRFHHWGFDKVGLNNPILTLLEAPTRNVSD